MALLGVVFLGKKGADPDAPTTAESTAPTPNPRLADAAARLEAGDLLQAGRLLEQTPIEARSREDFRAVERKWAQESLALNEQALEPANYRMLLGWIAERSSLPLDLRQAAKEKLAHQEAPAIDLSVLEAEADAAQRSTK